MNLACTEHVLRCHNCCRQWRPRDDLVVPCLGEKGVGKEGEGDEQNQPLSSSTNAEHSQADREVCVGGFVCRVGVKRETKILKWNAEREVIVKSVLCVDSSSINSVHSS